MNLKPLPRLPKSVRIGILVAAMIGLVTIAISWLQIERERRIDVEDVDRRAHALAHQLLPMVRTALEVTAAEAASVLGSHLDGYRRLIGYAVYRSNGTLLACGEAIPELTQALEVPVHTVLATTREVVMTIGSLGAPVHVLATPVIDHDRLTGVLVVLHDIAYVDERATTRLVYSMLWVAVLTIALLTIVGTVTWLAYERPLHRLADWMRRVRMDNALDSPPDDLPTALLGSESDRLAASFRAARSAGWARSRAAVHEERVWTRERLRTHAVSCLGVGTQLVVVSNREPYMHQLRDGKPQMIVPAGGLVTALDPVLQACGGLWVAHGAGDADRETADQEGRLTVPPGDARYTLRRVWLTHEEEQGYYYGFANEGLWPLCHLAHERPAFRASDWRDYQTANGRFADTVLDEIGSTPAVVLVQDYHLALLPALLKERRADLRVGLFWHIPWPNPESFRICPWRAELLRGILGADLIGFHLQQYCNNFLDTVDRMIEARLDWDHFAVELRGHTSLARPFPISVQDWQERDLRTREEVDHEIAELKALHKLDGMQLAVGVDRIDYTKGLPERFRAIARFLEKCPAQRGRFVFIQLGAPSRTHIRRYREHIAELEALADEINWQHRTGTWKPIRFLVAHHDARAVHAFLKLASVCVVSSLQDGMNLVAKEFVAAKEDGDGVLVLSEFAGAARELSDALLINPYDIERFAEAIQRAVEMPTGERRDRMSRMRKVVEEHNIYRWAARFLTELTATRSAAERAGEKQGPGPPPVSSPSSLADDLGVSVAT